MKHYHGTPIGGTRASAEEFSVGRLLLIPWKRPEDLERAMSLSRGFMVDNSAFSFWTTGEQPNWSEYIKWCKSFARHPRFDFALIPDVIDGTEKENDSLIAMWDKQCWHPIKVRGCPVWHLHESFDRLERLLGRWDSVAIGSSGQWPTPGVGDWWDRMADVFDFVCDKDGYPRKPIRGLRMLRQDIVERFPFTSCDSTNAVQNGVRESLKNGVDSSWGQMTIARRIERSAQSPSRWSRGEVQHNLFSVKIADKVVE